MCCQTFSLRAENRAENRAKIIKLRADKATQNYQTSSRNSTQNHQNGALGWLGKPLGEVLEAFWVPGPQESKRETNLGSLAHLGIPKGPPLGILFSTLFITVGIFSESCFRSSVLEASGLYFSWIWGVCWWYCLMFFSVFLDTFLRTHLGAALGVDFRRIWGRFGELFGTHKGPKCEHGGPKTVETRIAK